MCVTMYRMMSVAVCAVALSLTLAMTGCGSESGPTPTAGGDPDQPRWLLDAAPEQVVSVTEAKAALQPGDTVAMRARVGGRMEPMSEDGSVFTVMDASVLSCADMGDDDHCATPWDYCCETPESIRANAATVQLVDAAGTDVKQWIKPLDELVLVGKVGPRPTQDVLTLQVSDIYRVK